MDRDFAKSLAGSFAFHLLLFLLWAALFQSFRVVRTPLLMELTLIGGLSPGAGLGALEARPGEEPGPLEGKAGREGAFDEPRDRPRPPEAEAALEGETARAVRPTPTAGAGSPGDPAYLARIRQEAPIGISPRREIESRIKTTAGLGHLGVAGSPHGRALLEGQLAARGIRRQVYPEYPEWAKREGVEGSVKYRLTVLPSGLLRDDLSLEQTSGYRELDRRVAEALLQWEFEPLPPGVPSVDQTGFITFKFNFKTDAP